MEIINKLKGTSKLHLSYFAPSKISFMKEAKSITEIEERAKTYSTPTETSHTTKQTKQTRNFIYSKKSKLRKRTKLALPSDPQADRVQTSMRITIRGIPISPPTKSSKNQASRSSICHQTNPHK